MSDNANTPISSTDIAAVAKPYRLQFEEVQDSWVLLYPEGMVKLNGSAGEILSRCDGEKSVRSLVQELETAFGQSGLEQDVLSFLEIALSNRWVKLSESPS